jgi:ankyrin repeat protein
MRSIFARLSQYRVCRRADVALLLLALIGLASSCQRNDAGGEFRAAAANGNLAKVQSLLKDHPDLVFSHNNLGATALHWASANGHEDVARFLLANKANINARTNDGHTPLHWAAWNGHKELAKLLLTNKADV